MQDGIVTAGNSSQVSDGAAALLICSREAADENGGCAGENSRLRDLHVEPLRVMSAPIPCIEALLSRAELLAKDIDLYEHNEAFATASCGIKRHFDIPEGKFNIQGGAIAIGHPLGASGARCLMSLELITENRGALGIVTLCLGGGNAVGGCWCQDRSPHPSVAL